jgi:hypothetical protein
MNEANVTKIIIPFIHTITSVNQSIKVRFHFTLMQTGGDRARDLEDAVSPEHGVGLHIVPEDVPIHHANSRYIQVNIHT